MNEKVKRLFFGFEVIAPWPHDLPAGRILAESDRHMTVAFLGETPYNHLLQLLSGIPKVPFEVGITGKFDRCLFLPPQQPHVAAWNVEWLDDSCVIEQYQKALVKWIKEQKLHVDNRENFLPHVTICRDPKKQQEWQQAFTPLPLIVQNFHLYESLGQCIYKPIWSHHVKPPFVEVEHTADIAFNIYGENIEQIQIHAFVALAFKFPSLLEYSSLMTPSENLDDIICKLNEVVAKADEEKGCPFKAVSFHGDILKEEDNLLTWEMIIDV